MTPHESNEIRILAQAVDRLAIEVAGLRTDVDKRLRPLEAAEAGRSAVERIEGKMDEQKLRRRDIYVPLLVTQAAFAAASLAAVKYK